MAKYIVLALSCHSDKKQQIFRNGDIVLDTDFHEGHAEKMKEDGFLRDYTEADADAMLLKQRGIPLPDVTLPPVTGYNQMSDDELKAECRRVIADILEKSGANDELKAEINEQLNLFLETAPREAMISSLEHTDKDPNAAVSALRYQVSLRKRLSETETNPDTESSESQTGSETEPAKKTAETDGDVTTPDYEAMTNKELKVLLDEKKIPYSDKANKQTLIALLTAEA